ncbi:MAG: uroporphyrinogen-III decarboxylase-like protein [Chloroflexi bacterium]|nr:uroporphyrinogen-III decarboxylase-like protein [Chloroflexota bacterium]
MPSPDPQRLLSVLRHEGRPGPVPFIELFADQPIMEAVLGRRMPSPEPGDRAGWRQRALDLVGFYRQLGYDYVPLGVGSGLQRQVRRASDTATLSQGTRGWDNASTATIRSWDDYERYPWPRLADIDWTPLEEALPCLPADMTAIALGSGGVLEWVMWLMSYEHFAVALYDQPDLVAALFERVTTILTDTCNAVLDLGAERFSAYFIGDDMGHVTGTMISPRAMRQFVFPNQRKLADAAHAHGLPFLLHTCGNLSEVMEDLITSVQIDAKHSFEDKIEPVESVHARYGNRIALLGGVDVDLLTRGSEEQVRARTRTLLDALGPSGTWCLGTGNSVAKYIPVRNYVAMLDEGMRWNRERF